MNHRICHNHDFDWDNVQILHVKRTIKKLISEMINISQATKEWN